MKHAGSKQQLLFLLVSFLVCARASAQFVDDFSGPAIALDPQAANGWTFFTGDGSATMDFQQGDGYGSILVDATQDQRNIWWALIKREVSTALDLHRLNEPGYELRIEARIRVSHAPRRVNLHLNTQKTVDFHTHLMEFDIPDTLNWHTISMTTRDFEAEPGDRVNGQLALMDWGRGKYRVDVDYLKVDVVRAALAGPDQGAQVPYHPPVPPLETFTQEVSVAQDGMVDVQYPDVNFNDWYVQDGETRTSVLAVSGTQFVILRWDLGAFAGKQVAGHGLLVLTAHSVQRSSKDLHEFGKVRVVEILGGDPDWKQETVTYSSLCRGRPINEVLNGQMIIDTDLPEGQALITLSRPVLQRMIEGKTLGLALQPLGAIHATFYAVEHEGGKHSARLHFNVEE